MWRVEFVGEAESDLAKLDRPIRRRIIDRLFWFAENFDSVVPIPLGGGWKGFFKFRVGDWRVAYTFDIGKRLISIHYIDHRDRVYKRR